MLRRLVVLLQHERRDIKFNVLRVLLNFSNDRTSFFFFFEIFHTCLAKLRSQISDAQPYGFFKTLMLGNDEEILYKVAQVLGNLSDRSGTLVVSIIECRVSLLRATTTSPSPSS